MSRSAAHTKQKIGSAQRVDEQRAKILSMLSFEICFHWTGYRCEYGVNFSFLGVTKVRFALELPPIAIDILCSYLLTAGGCLLDCESLWHRLSLGAEKSSSQTQRRSSYKGQKQGQL